MSKRGAEDYITKENGSTPNSASEKVKMATAAQLAKRKMAVPKSRAGRTGLSPMPSTAPSNPFGGNNAFGASQNNQQPAFQNPAGVNFGTSQSFPPTDSSTNGGFAFSVPSQSNSFTFGQPASNNPFAGLNGSANNQQPQTDDSADTMMESPQKKPAFSSSMFGSGATNNNAPSTGFAFGQSTSQPSSQPSFAFGQTQTSNATPSASLFGPTLSKPVESNAAPSIFGQSTQSQDNKPLPAFGGFGQNSSQPPQQAQSSGFNFGQPAAAAPSSAPTFSFGKPATSAPAPSSAPTFSFGQTAAQTAPSSTLFGGSSQPNSSPFGSPAPPTQPESGAPTFGSAPAKPADNLFGGFGSSKPSASAPSADTAPQSEIPKPSLFGQPSTTPAKDASKPASTSAEQPKTNPFAGLFGQVSQDKPSTPQSASEPAKPAFNYTAPTQQSGLFSIPKPTGSTSASKSAEETPKQPLFNFGAPTSTPIKGLFSKSSAEPSASSNPPATLSQTNTGQSSFGFNKSDVKQSSNSSFLPTFKGSTSKQTSTPGNTSNSSILGGFSAVPASTANSTLKRPAEAQNSHQESSSPTPFGGSAPAKTVEPPKPPTGLFAPTSKSGIDTSPAPSPVPQSDSASEAPQRSVNTYPPTRVPPYLNGDDYKAYDNNYRLHSLNREFQKRIASLDPSQHDFENIIRNYVAARESIGESIGLYTRNAAGMKRKADDENDQRRDDHSSAKRTKPAEEPAMKTSLGSNSTSASVYQPVPSSSAKPSTNTNSAVQSTPSATSKTFSLFNSTVPSSKSVPSSATTNPFADLPKSSTNSAKEPTTQPLFSFGAKATTSKPVESTTPTKSPPKKPTFEPPKFAAPTGGLNFMSAFKKQSEDSIAKFAREAKEKRKAEEFDSDEDDEEEWNRKYDEEQKVKKAKLEAVSQSGFRPSFGNSTTSSGNSAFGFGNSTATPASNTSSAKGFVFGKQDSGEVSDRSVNTSDHEESAADERSGSGEDTGDAEGEEDDEDSEEADQDDLPEDEINGEDDDEEEDLETVMAKSRARGKSLFDRVTPNPNLEKESASTAKVATSIEKDTNVKPSFFSSSFGKTTTETSSFSPSTSTSSKEPIPAKTFSFTPTPSSGFSTSTPGASIFAGGTIKDGPIAGEGLFGSRPSTPSNVEKPKPNVFGVFGTPSNSGPSDNTWKKGTEIKFNTSTTEAPTLSITEPSPRKAETSSFANLFGANSNTNASPSTSGLGFGFTQTAPGYLAATSHLTGGSGTTSGISSRATSPGTTDNESVATNEEDYSNDTQVSLMETRPGEENENILFESRAKLMRFYTAEQIKGTKLTPGYNSAGLGVARLLKNKETGKTRIVVRAEPNANVILNALLQSAFKYQFQESKGAGLVKFNTVSRDGLLGWVIKVKTSALGQQLATLMEENKAASG